MEKFDDVEEGFWVDAGAEVGVWFGFGDKGATGARETWLPGDLGAGLTEGSTGTEEIEVGAGVEMD